MIGNPSLLKTGLPTSCQRGSAIAWLFAVAVLVFGEAPSVASPPALVAMAVSSGKTALDQDELGGNPFASALVDILRRRDLSLPAAMEELKNQTLARSDEFQSPEIPQIDANDRWSLSVAKKGERRVALVVVMAEYRLTSRLPSLPGAAFDAVRVSRATRKAGFSTDMVVAFGLDEFRSAIASFKKRSRKADVALIYTTGHGTETEGKIRLLGTDFPREQGKAALEAHSIQLSEVMAGASAKVRNFVFYGGCRDDPLQ